jgi:hypothetical protein
VTVAHVCKGRGECNLPESMALWVGGRKTGVTLRYRFYGDCSSVGRVGDCESLGRGFEPRRSPQLMALSSSGLGHLPLTEKITGSNPVRVTKL